jgi:hypothetical protein
MLASWCLTCLEGADGLAELLAGECIGAGHVQATPRAAVGVGSGQDQPRVEHSLQRGAGGQAHRRRIGEGDAVQPPGEVVDGQGGDVDAARVALDQP